MIKYSAYFVMLHERAAQTTKLDDHIEALLGIPHNAKKSRPSADVELS